MPQPLQLGHFAAGSSLANARISPSLCSCGTSGCVCSLSFLVLIKMLRVYQVGLWCLVGLVILSETYDVLLGREAGMRPLGQLKHPALGPVARAMKHRPA